MILPDNEILELEQRIAAHRAQLKRQAREAKARALRSMASPGALLAAAALGFAVANAVGRRGRKPPPHPERRKSDHLKAARATGLAGMALSAAMWFVRAQWGSPVRAAQALLQKMNQPKAKPSPPREAEASPRADTQHDTRSVIHP